MNKTIHRGPHIIWFIVNNLCLFYSRCSVTAVVFLVFRISCWLSRNAHSLSLYSRLCENQWHPEETLQIKSAYVTFSLFHRSNVLCEEEWATVWVMGKDQKLSYLGFFSKSTVLIQKYINIFNASFLILLHILYIHIFVSIPYRVGPHSMYLKFTVWFIDWTLQVWLLISQD